MGRKKVTIAQVARHAGVSIGTVSNYLNGTVSVSKERAERIKAAIEELEYTPDTLASSLRRKDSRTIYVLTPNLGNAFYTNVISTLMQHTEKAGYNIFILCFEYSSETECRQLHSLESSKPGTIVIIFSGFEDEEAIIRLTHREIHVILADRQADIPHTSSIHFDNREAMFEIVRILTEKGYQRIGMMIETPRLENIHRRYESFLEAVQFYGIEKESNVYMRLSLSLDKLKNSYLYMMEILDSQPVEDLPKAWIASSDYIAFGLMRALSEKGYRIPEDFAVVGVDNLEISGYVNPRLTTIEQDQELFGTRLWEVVSRLTSGGKNEHIMLPQKIKIRGSC